MSDGLLVARVGSGDDQAFEEIFERYGPALLGFCVRMLGSREWGEDALQLTFVAAYKALRRGGCDGALRPWLYAIARNRCLSELRVRREVPDSDRVTADRAAVDGPASVFARREQLLEIVEDIQRLPTDQRVALVLFELGDQSHEEIATALGVRREKVKALIFQAREGLQRGRSARESACSEVRERLANAHGVAPARGIVRAHVDRCVPCQEFEREVRRQRAALALVLPVAVSGKLKALVLASAFGHGGVATGAAASITGAQGVSSVVGATSAGSGPGVVAGATCAGSGPGVVAGATCVGSGPGVVAGAGGIGAGAAASAAGSASTALGGGVLVSAGAGAAGGSVSAVAGSAASTLVASAVGTEAVAGVGLVTSSVSVGTVAKLATVVAVAVGVGGVTRGALAPSPRPNGAVRAGKLQPAPVRAPHQPLRSGIVAPLAGPTQPGSQPAASPVAATGASSPATASTPAQSLPTTSSSTANAVPNTAANTAPPSAPSAPATGVPSSPIAASPAPGRGSATKTGPSPGAPTTTTATTTTTAASTTTTTASSSSSPGTSTSSTKTAAPPTTGAAGSSSAPLAGQGTSHAAPGASGSGSGDSAGPSVSSGGDSSGGVTHSQEHGPPITPPGCVDNPAPGCRKKTPRS